MLNLIFQSNPNGNKSKKTKTSSEEMIKTEENQRKCDNDKCSSNDNKNSNCCSSKCKSMPSIIAISTIIIGSLLMGIVSVVCVIKVQQNAEKVFQSFMQSKVFVSRVEKIVQNYMEETYPTLGDSTTR